MLNDAHSIQYYLELLGLRRYGLTVREIAEEKLFLSTSRVSQLLKRAEQVETLWLHFVSKGMDRRFAHLDPVLVKRLAVWGKNTMATVLDGMKDGSILKIDGMGPDTLQRVCGWVGDYGGYDTSKFGDAFIPRYRTYPHRLSSKANAALSAISVLSADEAADEFHRDFHGRLGGLPPEILQEVSSWLRLLGRDTTPEGVNYVD